jgi:hypothetical protein
MEKDLDLVARAREREKGFYPSDLERFPMLARPPAKQGEYERVESELEVLGHEFGLGRVVRGLVRVVGRDGGNVGYEDIGGQQVFLQLLVPRSVFFHPRTGEHVRPFCLVKDGIMTRVDLVPPVDVGSEQPSVAGIPECRDFMSRRMRPQHMRLVEIIAVGQTPTGMVFCEAEFVKVFVNSDDGRESVDGLVVPEMLLDEGA